MIDPESTALWQATLGGTSKEHERLRVSLRSVRERAAAIANDIQRWLPEYTVHDISHLDALWQTADLLIDDPAHMTPVEGYIFGVVTLVHDLGMGLTAYPGGLATLEQLPNWGDLIVQRLTSNLGRPPTDDECNHPADEIREQVTRILLREHHAERAISLPVQAWASLDSGPNMYLIEDTELRSAVGALAGRIAASHHWNVDELQSEFPKSIGAPVGLPSKWKIDPLKLACLLRVADACHLDYLRAPSFLYHLRMPASESADHWIFQQRLSSPLVEHGRLAFRSTQDFSPEEASAWWECFDALRMVDRELSQVDALLAETDRDRLTANGVVGIDAPTRLSQHIRVSGWEPVDTSLKVSDVASLVTKLGGRRLYDDDPTIVIRELVQNAADAIRARRLVDHRSDNWGEIIIRLVEENEQTILEVEDTGIGMTKSVLTEFLIDFGRSYWGSSQMLKDNPGLLSDGFQSTGRHGIGFYSVFMVANQVEVITRRFNKAHNDGLVLEFKTGLGSRPILRPAKPVELPVDGGTKVRITLVRECKLASSLVSFLTSDPVNDLARICPALDTDLVFEKVSVRSVVARASDWLSIPGDALAYRTGRFMYKGAGKSIGARLRDITAIGGETVARVALDVRGEAVVTDGGMMAGQLHGLSGLLLGSSELLSRKAPHPFVDGGDLREWANSQAELIQNEPNLNDDTKAEYAGLVAYFGGDTKNLPIGLTSDGWLSRRKLLDWSKDRKLVRVAKNGDLHAWFGDGLDLDYLDLHVGQVAPETIIIPSDTEMKVAPPGSDLFGPKSTLRVQGERDLGSIVMDTLAEAWGKTGQDQLTRSEDVEDVGEIDGSEVSGWVVSVTPS